MTSALPVELLDQIFADLTSARDLANASSVCKLFHAVVEPHLFRAVTITSLKQLRSFNQAMVDKSARAAYVLELEFAYPRLFGPGKLRTFEIMERKQGLDDFDNTLPKLTKLRTLSVGITTFFDSLPWQDFFGRAVFGDTLQSLETCILKYPRSLLSLTGFEPIFSHPTLKSLTICSADCSLRSWRALFQENPRTTLQRLEFVYCDIDPTALKRILSMTGGLKELIIKMDRGDSAVANFQDYAENLEEVATTLESLTIDTDASTSGSPFRLRNMIALRNVAIDASIWFGLLCTYPETTSEQLLRSILPPRIERMEIGGWGVTENADMSSTEDPLLQMLQPMFDDVQSLAPALKHIGRGPLPLPRVSPAFRKACMINGISTDF